MRLPRPSSSRGRGTLPGARILVAAVLFTAVFPARAEDPFPGVAAAYLVSVNGRTLWAKDADRPLPPASLTKVMTALLVVERGRLDEVVVIGREAARASGARLGLKQGERYRVRDLLAAAVIRSANDACAALARHAGGSVERFVARMNGRAKEMGLARTHFANPCGHDAPGHVASAQDLLEVTEAALRYPAFAELAATVATEIATVDRRRVFPIETTNALAGRYPGVTGVKTGYTARAGKCLIAAAERDGVRVMLVMLNSPDRWWDAARMLDEAFAQARHSEL